MLRIRTDGARADGAVQAWVEIDLAAVRHNVEQLRRQLAPACELIAVVKSNAYGHGLPAIARTALAAGAARLAVGSVAEGLALRAANVGAPILIAGPTMPEQAATAVAHDLTVSVASLPLADAVAAAARRPVDVEVEIDTGMRRHGVPVAEAAAFLRELAARSKLQLGGVYTHFAALTPAQLPALRAQLRSFRRALANLRLHGDRPRLHACNTLAALLLPAAHFDGVRIGGGLYGFDPLRGRGPVALRPALTLKCRLASVRSARSGDAVGYGGAHVCRGASRLGLLPLGYADGLSRALWSGAEVLVRGRRARIVGLVSMNLTVVDVSAVPDAAVGDEVVLLGRQGDDCIAAEDRVPVGGSVYEVTALLRSDLPRVYTGGGAEVSPSSAALRRTAARESSS
jgi:alanine racemase